MPKPLIRGARTTDATHGRSMITNAGLKISNTPRSDAYLRAVRKLDVHANLTQVDLAEVIDAIRQEFNDTWSAVPIGFVAHCYLGVPYETHILSIDGGIVEHFERGQALPGQLDSARPYARTEQYELIEVYPDRMVCVRPDGSTMTLEG